MKGINYHTWKDSEIIAQLEAYGIVYDKYVRKTAANRLKEEEVKRGVVTLPAKSEYDAPSALDEMKAKDPEMETMNVIFHRTSDLDAPYVFIGLNGVCFYIKRDEEIEIPKYLIDAVIKDAVEDRLTPVQQANGDINWITRKVQKYPYSLV